MPLTLADVDRWDASSIRDVASALAKRGASADEVRTGLTELPLIASWQGAGGDAARASLDKLSAYLAAHGEEMARVSSAARASADEIDGLKTTLHRLYDDARAEGFSIDPVSGTVTPTNESLVGDPIYALQQADLEVRVKELISAANQADASLAHAITTAGEHANPMGDTPSVADALARPIPEDPKQFLNFWEGLSPEQREALYRRDHLIANHDGMPGVDRDYYNRRSLGVELSQAQAAQDRADALKAQHPDWADGQNVPPPNKPGAIFDNRLKYEAWQRDYDAAKDGAKYLPDLQAVDNAVRDRPDRKLLLLDTETGRQARAAIAVGDPDTADHVSVTAPGLNTTVHGGMEGMANEASRARDEATNQLIQAGRGHESVATIAWIGYDPPQVPGADDLGASLAGGWEVSHDDVAKAGAQNLASFYDGINATHQGPLDLTAIGHSYGSLTTGLALQVPGDHGVDNALFYGSPGIEASTPAQLGLQNGHVFTMATPDDPITKVFDVPPLAHALAPVLPPPFNSLATGVLGGLDASGAGAFGPNPATNPNFTHLETGAVTVTDGRSLGAASGHSDYPRWDSTNNQPYTTGYNIAAVIAGTAPVQQK
ncbi:alpha/beta hydrolase [Mycolicibacterium neoaurum]|uniref:alpha/beta hydrolase n=1 Tax=Mycolicibacterium neoaurum TaxID=1795 RepID=UPI0026730D5A|nr:alpha/beta hydrolase [Mycolicibacterium neoaurum]MDO3398666.1 alpha/beta hydrolase [Mycolicibacterium neoaurum]